MSDPHVMATNGILVTSWEKGFGPESIQYAKRNNITLIDGAEFVKLMRKHGIPGFADSEESPCVSPAFYISADAPLSTVVQEARKDDKHHLKNRHQNSVRPDRKRPANAAGGSADATQRGKRPCAGESREGDLSPSPPRSSD